MIHSNMEKDKVLSHRKIIRAKSGGGFAIENNESKNTIEAKSKFNKISSRARNSNGE
jgi:hypothetical protein